jgi:hypothetical protein
MTGVGGLGKEYLEFGKELPEYLKSFSPSNPFYRLRK